MAMLAIGTVLIFSTSTVTIHKFWQASQAPQPVIYSGCGW